MKFKPMHFKTLGLAAATLITCASSASAALTASLPDTTSRPGWTVVTFTAGSGNWDVPLGVTTVEVLVVGGGGGTTTFTSGAGAGGLYYSGSWAVSGSTVAITVGAGGAGNATAGANGGDSSFGSIIAYGGQGMQGYRPTDDVTNGGPVHGGNQGGYSIDGGGTINPGTQGIVFDWDGGFDSGCGAGAAGTHGNSETGGIGVQNSITGTATYYAGGGGALVDGLGGLGGGGMGGSSAQDGLANTGGGAGGGWGDPDGASGGSGVVIVAYQAVPEPSAALLGGLGLLALLRRRR